MTPEERKAFDSIGQDLHWLYNAAWNMKSWAAILTLWVIGLTAYLLFEAVL